MVGLLFSPADACRFIQRIADAVLQRPGGHGGLLELVERILQLRGRLERLHREGWEGGND